MIDLFLKFDSREQAISIGEQLGYTTWNSEINDWLTVGTENMLVCVIGSHFYPDGTMVEDPYGNLIPHKISDGKYWVMLRDMNDTPIPPEVQPLVVYPNPDDPMVPQQRWA
jgi:hypothetical protein